MTPSMRATAPACGWEEREERERDEVVGEKGIMRDFVNGRSMSMFYCS
jgi:hypothetical protein